MQKWPCYDDERLKDYDLNEHGCFGKKRKRDLSWRLLLPFLLCFNLDRKQADKTTKVLRIRLAGCRYIVIDKRMTGLASGSSKKEEQQFMPARDMDGWRYEGGVEEKFDGVKICHVYLSISGSLLLLVGLL